MSKSKGTLAAAWNYSSDGAFSSVPNRLAEPIKFGPTAEDMLSMNNGAKLVIILVGKAARGKSILAGKIKRYLHWLGYKIMHFESSEYRKKMFGSIRREKSNVAEVENKMINDLVRYLQSGGQVAIFDTKNNTKERRQRVADQIESLYHGSDKKNSDDKNYNIFWIESYCDDMEQVEKIYNESNCGKYSSKTDPAESLADFRKYLEETDAEYQTLDPMSDEMKNQCFIKLINFGESMVTHKVKGYIESKLASFCVNIHTETRYVLLVRHGESEYNVQDRLGGDSELTKKGRAFAAELGKYIKQLFPVEEKDKEGKSDSGRSNKPEDPVLGDVPTKVASSEDLVVYTSNLKRSMQTAVHIPCFKRVAWYSLSEIDSGICEDMSYTEFKEQMATEYAARQRDKLNWRYPQGESYVDVKKRLEPVIYEIERERKHLLIIGHRAVLRCLYSYFVDIAEAEIPFLPFPLHTIVALRGCLSGPNGWKVKEGRIVLYPDEPTDSEEERKTKDESGSPTKKIKVENGKSVAS